MGDTRSKMQLVLKNSRIELHPADDFEEDEILAFKDDTDYFVRGHRHDHRFKMGKWNGKVSLITRLRRDRQQGTTIYRAPVGMLPLAQRRLKIDEIFDERRVPGVSIKVEWNKDIIPSLRDYQQEAVDAVVKDRGVRTGKGLLRLPTRSGKTVIAGGAFAELGVKTVFFVQSKSLLQQSVDFFRKALVAPEYEGQLIGKIGDGVKEFGWLTVVCVQSLIAKWEDDDIQDLLETTDLVFFDECHHLEGETWREAMTVSDAFYKVGLSATIHQESIIDCTDDTTWIFAATGPILYSLDATDLINEGWLCRPRVRFHVAPLPEHETDVEVWQSVYKDHIVENDARNALIAKIARRHVMNGDRVLITTKQIKHSELIRKHLATLGLKSCVLTGSTKLATRAQQTERFRVGEIDVMLGTVFGEGVDLPWLDTVIVGGALQSPTLTLQRLRNLTPYDKENERTIREPMRPVKEVDVYDFLDLGTNITTKHSKARLETYRRQSAFRLINMDKGDAR